MEPDYVSDDEMLARYLILQDGGELEAARTFIARMKDENPERVAGAAKELHDVLGK